ncbi:MAG: rRNA pseudouridine synthase [Chloroflexi bacterium]|nr:rRNA pseudouridine synthase [Chloroflexota bacterium]
MSRERLQKYLARCGVASRRASEAIIVAGRVWVNGVVVSELGTSVDPDQDRVEVDGRRVMPPTAHTYLALNKPTGVVSTASDPQGRRTVIDLVSDLDRRLYPVGRLDYDSEGLLILTDDGDLAMMLTHPRHDVEKEYRAFVRGDVPDRLLGQLARGVELDGRRTAPARFTVEERREAGTWLRVVLHEGRNRQIRRMAAEVGLDVIRLIRVRIGTLLLGDLPTGAWRDLRPAEVAALQRNGV